MPMSSDGASPPSLRACAIETPQEPGPQPTSSTRGEAEAGFQFLKRTHWSIAAAALVQPCGRKKSAYAESAAGSPK